MVIRKYKNLIGLCACEGCKKAIAVKVEVADKINLKIKQRFYVCNDCSWKVFEKED